MTTDEALLALLAKANAPIIERLDRIEALLRASSPEDRMDTAQAAVYLKKVRADGSPNLDAFKAFLARTPLLPREKVGRKLLFSRAALDGWIAERKR